jgi:putative (di)nucleoside polyphosphate hydrolase
MQSLRLGVGIMLINSKKEVFVGHRIDAPNGQFGWQMPQGGIDAGEAAHEAVMRELEEEIGTSNAVIIAEASDWFEYKLPNDLQKKLWHGRYYGVRQKWFLMNFLGQNNDIDLNKTRHPEFSDWRWVQPKELLDLIVPFKKDMYKKILEEFKDVITQS